MGRARDSNALIGNDLNLPLAGQKTSVRIRAQVHFMMMTRYLQRLRQLTGTGAKLSHSSNSSPLLHQRNPTERLERAD